MTSPLDPLLQDFVGWIAREPRTYAEALEAWRTSCPRLTVWEDAIDRGLVERRASASEGTFIVATRHGLEFLEHRREGASRPRSLERADLQRTKS